MKIIRKELTARDISPYGTFWDADCECVMSVPPGGGTPYANPAADPRTDPAGLLPARTSASPQCDAAANMVDKLKASVNELVQSLNQFQIATGTLALFLAFFPAVGEVADFFIALGEVAIAIGSSTIEGAFSDDQWALILCILNGAINTDGTVTATQVSAILTEIGIQCNSTVNSVMLNEINGLGFVGLTNAGATGDVTGDCSDCLSPASIIASPFRPDTIVESLGGTRWRITSYVFAPTLESAGWQDVTGGGFLLKNILYTSGGPDGAIYTLDCSGTLFTEGTTARWEEKETFMGQDDASSPFVVEFDAFLEGC